MGIIFLAFLAFSLLNLASPRDLQDARACTFGESWFTSFCTLTCSDGFAKDENGCDLCRCADQPPCPPHACALVPDTPYGQAPCPFGVAADEDGCIGDPCDCYQQPEGCNTMPCYYWTTCAVYRTDGNGCAICYPPCADGSMPGIIIG
ncbi:BPTI/Kunitz domain-containing protein 4-like [Branchiostoma lanceolatum]|uniref:BPTI/Kunitz domain-containing protein 4-like n=1 Tax=Branchiostoma lanceolatum TaxID=7740 RepID=UPI00345658F8